MQLNEKSLISVVLALWVKHYEWTDYIADRQNRGKGVKCVIIAAAWHDIPANRNSLRIRKLSKQSNLPIKNRRLKWAWNGF